MNRAIPLTLCAALVAGGVYYFWPDGSADTGKAGKAGTDGTAGGGEKTAPLEGDKVELPQGPNGAKTGEQGPKAGVAAKGAAKTSVPQVPLPGAEMADMQEQWRILQEGVWEKTQFDQALNDQEVLLDGAPLDPMAAKELRQALIDGFEKTVGPSAGRNSRGEGFYERLDGLNELMQEFVPGVSSGQIQLKLERGGDGEKRGFVKNDEQPGRGKLQLKLRSKSFTVRLTLDQGTTPPKSWQLYEDVAERSKRN